MQLSEDFAGCQLFYKALLLKASFNVQYQSVFLSF